ncbi:MAG TPA: squalene/phytoene synthase family protein [Anaerolineae bacterium]|nr:squalene/phytoene synthase family protein [Anaerolineae bacterium]
MILQAQTWEHSLLLLAHEAWQSLSIHREPVQNAALLQRAYAHCEAITAEHSRSFHMASQLLPVDKRRAVRALYAFCRTSDDVVDRPSGDAEAMLAAWRERVLMPHPPEDDPVAVAWADTLWRFRIPHRYVEQLIGGVARDLLQQRYETFDDLAAYSYGVASTVGLMSMHITGFSGPEAIPYAIKLGVALQVTNVLRDVGEDYRNGRVYLPQEDLRRFGIAEDQLAEGRVDDRWRAFMQFQIDRNRRLYEDAWPGIAMLNADGRFAIAAAAMLYRAILDDIEAHDYDVFTRRAHVGTIGRLRRLIDLRLRGLARA